MFDLGQTCGPYIDDEFARQRPRRQILLCLSRMLQGVSASYRRRHDTLTRLTENLISTPRQLTGTRGEMGDRRTNDRQRLRSQRRELHSRGWTTGGADYHQRPPHSQSLEIPLHAARVCEASGRFTVITDLRLSPACTARATAQRGQRRTADLIPDWLTFPTNVNATPRQSQSPY